MIPRPKHPWPVVKAALTVIGLMLPAACITGQAPDAPLRPELTSTENYLIGPGDTLQIFVWRNPELTTTVPVRPDGRVSTPLNEDVAAAGKTPTVLARDIEKVLSRYVQSPIVTVIPSQFFGPFDQQIRVVGQAAQPRAIPYRANMSVLDVMIEVGGLTEFAAGNRAKVLRHVGGEETAYRVRLDDLLRDGDVTANVGMAPGDILIIPEAWF